jgi:hypothetical protein
VAGSHTCSKLPESSTLDEVIVILITRSWIHTGKDQRFSGKGSKQTTSGEQTGLVSAGNLTGAGVGASWTGAQILSLSYFR